MNPFIVVVLEIAATVAVLGLTNLAVLTLRNPMRGQAVRSSGIEILIIAASLAGILGVLALLGAGILTLIPSVILGLPVFAGVAIGIFLGLERLMNMKGRLEACDAGQSPFARDGVAVAPKQA